MSRHLVARHFRGGDGGPPRIDASIRDLFQRIREAILALLSVIANFFSLPSGGHTSPHRFGPQSLRPLPLWYYWDPRSHQKRWRKFDEKDSMFINEALERWSKTATTGKRADKLPRTGWTVHEWDSNTKSGLIRHKKAPFGSNSSFVKKSPSEAAQIKLDNFEYDYTLGKDAITIQHYLKSNPHVMTHFKNMIMKELNQSNTHVFFYHSFGASGLMYDINATLARLVMGDDAAGAGAILPRIDRSKFNNMSVKRIKSEFLQLFPNGDVDKSFRDIGMSVVMNCIAKDAEATVIQNFKTNYSVGTSLNEPLDELLNRFQLSGLREQLINIALEADVDVQPYMGTRVFWRDIDDDDDVMWKPWSNSSEAQLMLSSIEQFLEDQRPRETGPITVQDTPYAIRVERDAFGAIRGTVERTLPPNESWRLLINTPHTGQYLQLAVPHDLVAELGYASQLHDQFGNTCYGYPDMSEDRSLVKVKNRKMSVGGQARIIPRPDLFWTAGVQQATYQFSQHAENARDTYLRKMKQIIGAEIQGKGTMADVQNTLKPPGIKVLTFNVFKENEAPALAQEFIASKTPHFALLQEANKDFRANLMTRLTARPGHDYAILNQEKSTIVYDQARFELCGGSFHGYFKHNGRINRSRPIGGAVFQDKLLRRRIMVISVHAPHHSYSVTENLRFAVQATRQNSKIPIDDLTHFVIGGDWNKSTHTKRYSLPLSKQMPEHNPVLQSMQGSQHLEGKARKTHGNGPIDNILYGSYDANSSTVKAYSLEMVKAEIEDTADGKNADPKRYKGSDHMPVFVEFAA